MKVILVADNGDVVVANPDQLKMASMEDGRACLCLELEEKLHPLIAFDVALAPIPAEKEVPTP